MEENVKKIILAVYVDASNFKGYEKVEFFSEVKNYVEDAFCEEKGIKAICFPCESGETRVECINPVLVSEEEYAKASDVVTKFEEELRLFEEKYKND